MKKTLFIFIFIIFFIGIAYDLKYGTLEASTLPDEEIQSNLSKEEEVNESKGIPHEQWKVKRGQTVLTIVEILHDGNTTVSIEQIVDDFEMLNPGEDAQKIQMNETYLFPIYNE